MVIKVNEINKVNEISIEKYRLKNFVLPDFDLWLLGERRRIYRPERESSEIFWEIGH